MNFAAIISTYFTLILLLTAAFLIALCIFVSNQKLKFIRYSDELKLQYGLLISPLFLLFLKSLVTAKNFFQPIAKVWSTGSIRNFSEIYTDNLQTGFLSLSPERSAIDIGSIVGWSVLLVTSALVIWGLLFAKDLFRLRGILSSSYPMKRIGRLAIDLSDSIIVPFSYWIPGKMGVVIPTAMLANNEERRISLLHEIQHHRQRDTQWIYLVWIYRVLFFWNPAIYIWNRIISEVQEFACDEILVDRKKVSSKAYASCLFRVAELARNQERGLACATGLTFLTSEPLLKRRIKGMFTNKQNNRSKTWITAGCAMALLTGVALASNNLIQDRRISLADAQEMAVNAQKATDFPIVVNDLVLKQLNRYLGTPEGREFMRDSLARMKNYQAMIEKSLDQYDLPLELLAVPIVESGYQNLSQSPNAAHGAGIWMFIKSTARNYGLKVDDNTDERLSAELETDAAMRYLSSSNLQFQDWLLALLAYNVGDGRVQQGIEATGSRNAWTLIRSGWENDQDYLPRVMAAVIILKNPSYID